MHLPKIGFIPMNTAAALQIGLERIEICQPADQYVRIAEETTPTQMLLSGIKNKGLEMFIPFNKRLSPLPLWIDLGSFTGDKLAAITREYEEIYNVVGVEAGALPIAKVRDSFRKGELDDLSYICANSLMIPDHIAEAVSVLYPNNIDVVVDGLKILKPGGRIYIVIDSAFRQYEEEIYFFFEIEKFVDIRETSRELMNRMLGGALDKGPWDFYYGLMATKGEL